MAGETLLWKRLTHFMLVGLTIFFKSNEIIDGYADLRTSLFLALAH